MSRDDSFVVRPIQYAGHVGNVAVVVGQRDDPSGRFVTTTVDKQGNDVRSAFFVANRSHVLTMRLIQTVNCTGNLTFLHKAQVNRPNVATDEIHGSKLPYAVSRLRSYVGVHNNLC